MLSVWTAQYSYSGEDRLDITVGGAKKGLVTPLGKLFVPNELDVGGHKAFTGDPRYVGFYKKVSDEQYRENYKKRVRKAYEENHRLFMSIFTKGCVTLVCFCPSGKFCHRHIAVEIIQSVANYYDIPIAMRGER